MQPARSERLSFLFNTVRQPGIRLDVRVPHPDRERPLRGRRRAPELGEGASSSVRLVRATATASAFFWGLYSRAMPPSDPNIRSFREPRILAGSGPLSIRARSGFSPVLAAVLFGPASAFGGCSPLALHTGRGAGTLLTRSPHTTTKRRRSALAVSIAAPNRCNSGVRSVTPSGTCGSRPGGRKAPPRP